MNYKTKERLAINANTVNYRMRQHQTRKCFVSTIRSQTQLSITLTTPISLEKCRKSTVGPNTTDNFHAHFLKFYTFYN